jgi:rubrerythrin
MQTFNLNPLIMKTLSVTLIAALFIFSGFNSYAGTSAKTVENLKAAFKGESTASAKYAAYAEKAKAEGFVQIAAMFQATSKAEAIHAANHKSVLVKLGQKVDDVKPEFTVKSTKENLADALKGESYEIATMYPEFITAGKSEDVKDAVKSFTWAMDTEKKHQKIYQNAISALDAGKATTLPGIYWVCPKCGNTYDVAKPAAECGFCMTKSEKYIKFGK